MITPMNDRLFVAIPLNGKIREELFLYQKLLDVNAKFVEKENLHITVQFLGEKEKEAIPEIIEILTQQTQNMKSFTLLPDKIKASPVSRPRLIALWFADDASYQALVNTLKPFANKISKRRQLPHITLARIREKGRGERVAIPKQTFAPITVRRIALISSQLTRQGPVYTTLKTFSLFE